MKTLYLTVCANC